MSAFCGLKIGKFCVALKLSMYVLIYEKQFVTGYNLTCTSPPFENSSTYILLFMFIQKRRTCSTHVLKGEDHLYVKREKDTCYSSDFLKKVFTIYSIFSFIQFCIWFLLSCFLIFCCAYYYQKLFGVNVQKTWRYWYPMCYGSCGSHN